MIRVRVLVALELFEGATANTYVGHPWPGWDQFSADFWGPRGRGDPLAGGKARALYRYFRDRTKRQGIRHIIWRHRLWTPWGGESWWEADDHKGDLEHVHVTWWPISEGG